jgi:ABC-2 type transport system ATP-binding protein
VFGSRTAVEAVSLSVHAGEIVALLGPNGAGKTTTLRVLAGLIAPTTGRVSVNGSRGLLTEDPGLWDTLSVRSNLLTHARLQDLDNPGDRVDAAMTALGVADRARERAGRLSKGLRQRVALARALLHDPAAVLLDEPTSGLDPAHARRVRDLIAGLAREGRAVLMCTHNLAEAEELAHRIGILNVRLLALDTPGALRGSTGDVRVDVDVEGDASPWLAVLGRPIGARSAAAGSRLHVVLDAMDRVPDVVGALTAAGARITRVVPHTRTLEDVYLDLVGRP